MARVNTSQDTFDCRGQEFSIPGEFFFLMNNLLIFKKKKIT